MMKNHRTSERDGDLEIEMWTAGFKSTPGGRRISSPSQGNRACFSYT